MNSTINTLLAEQGENVLKSMKELKRLAKKKGKARFDAFEKFCANQHSFGVYTFTDPTIQEMGEIKAFQENMEAFRDTFQVVSTNFDETMNISLVDSIYEATFTSYNEMVIEFNLLDRRLDAKRF